MATATSGKVEDEINAHVESLREQDAALVAFIDSAKKPENYSVYEDEDRGKVLEHLEAGHRFLEDALGSFTAALTARGEGPDTKPLD